MKIPKVLYHGTTLLRYAMMQVAGKLDCHTQKFASCDRMIDGYLYFTDNMKEAGMYGFNTYLLDLRMNESQLKFVKSYDRDPRFKDPVVLLLRTSQLRDGMEVDPEHYSVNQPNIERRRAELLAESNYDELDKLYLWESTWYRHKGDIPYKYIISYKTISYSWFEETPGMIDSMNRAIDMGRILEMFDIVKSNPQLFFKPL